MSKEQLKTVRFSQEESRQVEDYLQKNRLFESFSSLARVATLSFISQEATIELNPIQVEKKAGRPRFLWDYDMGEIQVREILNAPGASDKKKWLMARILSEARFDEVFNYLNLEQISRHFSQLKLPAKVKDRWEYALKRWKSHDE